VSCFEGNLKTGSSSANTNDPDVAFRVQRLLRDAVAIKVSLYTIKTLPIVATSLDRLTNLVIPSILVLRVRLRDLAWVGRAADGHDLLGTHLESV
jgi:hypothetical protein